MKYSYVDIRKLQNAAEVDFETADKALKKANGNFSKAEYFARKRKVKTESRSSITGGISEIFGRFFNYRFIAYRGKTTYINIRMWVMLLLLFFLNGTFYDAIWLLLFPFIITIFIGVEYKIVSLFKKTEEPSVNMEPAPNNSHADEDLVFSEEVVKDDDEGFVKVEIDK